MGDVRSDISAAIVDDRVPHVWVVGGEEFVVREMKRRLEIGRVTISGHTRKHWKTPFHASGPTTHLLVVDNDCPTSHRHHAKRVAKDLGGIPILTIPVKLEDWGQTEKALQAAGILSDLPQEPPPRALTAPEKLTASLKEVVEAKEKSRVQAEPPPAPAPEKESQSVPKNKSREERALELLQESEGAFSDSVIRRIIELETDEPVYRSFDVAAIRVKAKFPEGHKGPRGPELRALLAKYGIDSVDPATFGELGRRAAQVAAASQAGAKRQFLMELLQKNPNTDQSSIFAAVKNEFGSGVRHGLISDVRRELKIAKPPTTLYEKLRAQKYEFVKEKIRANPQILNTELNMLVFQEFKTTLSPRHIAAARREVVADGKPINRDTARLTPRMKAKYDYIEAELKKNPDATNDELTAKLKGKFGGGLNTIDLAALRRRVSSVKTEAEGKTPMRPSNTTMAEHGANSIQDFQILKLEYLERYFRALPKATIDEAKKKLHSKFGSALDNTLISRKRKEVLEDKDRGQKAPRTPKVNAAVPVNGTISEEVRAATELLASAIKAEGYVGWVKVTESGEYEAEIQMMQKISSQGRV